MPSLGTRRMIEWVAIGLAVVLILAGLGLLLLGAESTPVKLEIWGIKLESSSLGIVVVVLGAGLVGLILKLLGNSAATDKQGEDETPDTTPALGFALSVSALDGHPVVHHEESDVFCGGASVTVTLSRANAGISSIVVNEIEISEIKFKPGSQPDLHYKIEAKKIIGAGMKSPDRYSISLIGQEALPAKWVDEEGESCLAQGSNILTASRRYPQLYPEQGEDVEMIEIRVLPQDAGYYEIIFAATYTVGAERNRVASMPVRIYFE